MADILSARERSRRMALVRQRNTGPELWVRQILHRNGFRFRINQTRLPGSPDIVLSRWRTVVFVHGCFWHMHNCSLFKLPATRRGWWQQKLEANIRRDKRAIEELKTKNWRIVVVWQCAIKGRDCLTPERFDQLLSRAIRGKPQLVELKGSGHSKT
jgi:DNA mismatch endonuclease, patch repair protein